VKRHRSVVADQAGRVWFSLNRGISVVDPERLTRNSAPAITHVETISADGSPVATTGVVRIPGGRQRVTFAYIGLSLAIPDRTRYRYMLEGFDRAWSEPVAIREAVYTNLAPRPYRLRVVASNPDGVWNGAEASVAFEVDPLYWQTWWFRIGAVAALIAIFWLTYRYRLRQATRRISAGFKERLAERTRIAQELHDTLLQGFISASMQVHVAANAVPPDSPAKPTLVRAMQLMRQVIDEGRNAVRGLRSSKSVSLDLEEAFSRIQQELDAQGQEVADVDFHVTVEGEQRALHPILRDELYRIGREALLNAFRHAHAKTIEMNLTYSSRRLSILVRDDGRGIDPNILESGRDGHWGLSGMRERAERIGARFSLTSGHSTGTQIQLSVPARIAYQNASNGAAKWFRWHDRQGTARGEGTLND
jgi:signal transduction histidine kinase